MPEFTEAPVTPPQKEQTTIRQRLKNFGGRIMQFVKRPERNYKLPEQAFEPAAAAEAEKKNSPERAKRIEWQGCAVRAIMSAVAFATHRKNISATYGNDGEWQMRLNQIDQGRKPVEMLSKDLMDLYTKYREHDTPLGNALKEATITQFNLESEDMLRKRIKAKEQVMVFTPSSNPEDSHICHVGLDKRGHFISFSDEKRSKKRYQPANLPRGGFITFSVTPKGTAPLQTNVRSTDLAMAA